MSCPVIQINNIIGKKWVTPIIEEIALGKFYGFNKFLKKADVTPRILSRQMKELEEAGIVEKRYHVQNNRKITEYILTKKGAEFHKVIVKAKKWNIKWNNIQKLCLHTPCTECVQYKI